MSKCHDIANFLSHRYYKDPVRLRLEPVILRDPNTPLDCPRLESHPDLTCVNPTPYGGYFVGIAYH